MKVFYLTISIVLTIRTDATETPVGHGEILGKHRPSDGHVPVLTESEFPTAQEFWDKYVSIRRPVVFRAPGKLFPAHKKWTDEYLIENFGDLEVKLEHKTEKKKTPVGAVGVGRDTIKSYLETYRTKQSYIVSQLPDPMAKDVLVPPFMMCGTIYERILESNLWLSAGGTKSMLHRDADHALNCLLNGTKDWILIDPKQEDLIPIAEGDEGYGGYAVLDVDRVNLLKYPKFKKVRWEYANMTPGDCLYLPCGYWHQVRSYGEKNLATTVLWSRIKSFNGSDCAHKKLEFTPLSDTGMVWTYPGFGPQTLGNLDPFELRERLERYFDAFNKEKLTFKELSSEYNRGGRGRKRREAASALGRTLVDIFDLEKKGYVVKDDLKTASVEQLKKAANAIDPDPANTDIYEHYMFQPAHVKLILFKALDRERMVLNEASLVEQWMKHGGSEKIARDLFKMLSNGSSGEIKQKEMENRLPEALKLFEKTGKDDPSANYYQEKLKEDKAMFGEKTDDLDEKDEELPEQDGDEEDPDKEEDDDEMNIAGDDGHATDAEIDENDNSLDDGGPGTEENRKNVEWKDKSNDEPSEHETDSKTTKNKHDEF